MGDVTIGAADGDVAELRAAGVILRADTLLWNRAQHYDRMHPESAARIRRDVAVLLAVADWLEAEADAGSRRPLLTAALPVARAVLGPGRPRFVRDEPTGERS